MDSTSYTVSQLKRAQENYLAEINEKNEIGDLTIEQKCDQIIVILGQSRVGKSTLVNYLKNYELIGIKGESGRVYFKLTVDGKAKQATIGHTDKSQTQIPNFMKIKIPGSGIEILIADTPGHGDTHGIGREISNSYFLYKIFSSFKKIKFILAFEYNRIPDLIKSLQVFVKNFVAITPGILQATSFLFTKVSNSPQSKEYIKKSLSQIADGSTEMNYEEDEKDKIKTVIKHVVDSDKIYLFHQAQVGINTKKNDMLQRIYKATKFWERQQDPSLPNKISMNQMHYSVSKRIYYTIIMKQNEKKLYQKVMENLQNILDKIFGLPGGDALANFSILAFITQMVEDCKRQSDSKDFIKIMQNFVKENYKFNPLKHDKLRKDKKNTLFGKPNIISTIANNGFQKLFPNVKQALQSNYWFSKFTCLREVQNLCKQLYGVIKAQDQNDFLKLSQIQELFVKFFQLFNQTLARKENQINAVVNYGYYVHQILETCKVFELIMFTQKDLFRDNKLPLPFTYDKAKDCIDQIFAFVDKLDQVEEDFLLKIENSEEAACEELIWFYSQKTSENEEFYIKYNQLLMIFIRRQFKAGLNARQIRTLGKWCMKSRANCWTIMKAHKEDEDHMYDRAVMQVEEATCWIAQALDSECISIDKSHIIELYRSINQPAKMIEILTTRMKSERDVDKKIFYRWDLIKEAIKYEYKQLALREYHNMISSIKPSQRQQAIQKMISLRTYKGKDPDGMTEEQKNKILDQKSEDPEEMNEFEKNLLNKQYCSPWDETVQQLVIDVFKTKGLPLCR